MLSQTWNLKILVAREALVNAMDVAIQRIQNDICSF